jgi:pyridoxamine 5'-phosphate oxidase
MSDFNQSLQDLRESYDQEPLRCSMLADDPVAEFEKWMQDAIDAKVYDPNACSLATVDESGRPSARAVLLKGWMRAGLFFIPIITVERQAIFPPIPM